MKLLKKISIATSVANSKAVLRAVKDSGETGPEVALLRVVGSARAYETGMSTYGEFLRFKGEFHGTDLTTGEAGMSPVVFLPAPVDALLANQIDEFSEGGKKSVEFAFDISVVPDPATEVGYQYRVRTLTETKPADALGALLDQVNAAAPIAIAGSQGSLPVETDGEAKADSVKKGK